MFTKSDSLKIFIIVTITAVIIFLILSYDTLNKIPIQTNQSNISNSVIRGKILWESNNCMGCHTILGEGAYYAPELTKVYNKRGEEFLLLFLKDPNKMYPGKRKMVKYTFSDQNLYDLISFFKWISEMDCNGFPPISFLKKYLVSEDIENNNINKPDIIEKLCLNCHIIKGRGNLIDPAPVLDNISKIRNKDYLIKWLTNPYSIKEDSQMPNFNLSESLILDIVNYLLVI